MFALYWYVVKQKQHVHKKFISPDTFFKNLSKQLELAKA